MEKAKNYVGEKKIASFEEDSSLTPLGGKIIKVVYEDGETEFLTEKTFELVSTEVPTDANYVQATRLHETKKGILAVISEYDISVGEIDKLCNSIAFEIGTSFNRATNFLWTKDDKKFIPGVSVMDSVTLLGAEKVLKTIPREDGESAA